MNGKRAVSTCLCLLQDRRSSLLPRTLTKPRYNLIYFTENCLHNLIKPVKNQGYENCRNIEMPELCIVGKSENQIANRLLE